MKQPLLSLGLSKTVGRHMLNPSASFADLIWLPLVLTVRFGQPWRAAFGGLRLSGRVEKPQAVKQSGATSEAPHRPHARRNQAAWAISSAGWVRMM